MAFTAGFSVNVGDPTKASDVDVLAANDDYLKNAIDTFIANDANNRVLTATGSGTANAESNLTFDGSTLTVTGTVSATTFSGNVTGGTISGSTGSFTSTISTSGGFVTVAGNPSAGTISSNGNGQIGGLTGNGLYMYGKGSTYDLALANATTNLALAIPTGGGTTPDVYIPNSLGVGTSSPSAKVDIPIPSYDASTTDGMIRFTDPVNSSHANIQAYYVSGAGSDIVVGSNAYINTSGTWSRWSTSYAGAAVHVRRTGDINFLTNTSAGVVTERMALTSAGLLGIGTTAPNAPLAVASKASTYEGMELITPSGDGSGVFQFGVHDSGGTSGRNIEFRRGGSDGFDTLSLRITSTGAIEIPNQNAINELTFTGTDYTNIFSNTTNGMQFGTTGAGSYLSFFAANAEAIYIDSSQRVGIGTSSPQNTLHVKSAADNAYLEVESSAVNSNPGIRLTNDVQGWQWQLRGAESDSLVAWDVTGGVGRLYLTTSGNMGLGVTPSAWLSTIKALQVGDGASVYNSGGAGGDVYYNNNWYVNSSSQNIYLNNGYALSYGQAGGEHRWFTAASGTAGNTVSFTQAMTLTNAGLLGLGTSSPSHTLDVNGSMQIERNGSSPLLRFTDTSSSSRWIGIPDGSSRFAIYGTNGSTEELVLDSSGNVGIGTSSPAVNFVVSDGPNTGLEINPYHGGLEVSLYAYDRTASAYRDLRIAGDELIFLTGSSPTATMTLESNGDILVNGATNYIQFGAGNNVLTDNDAVAIYGGGFIWSCRQGNVAYFSRAASTGSLVVFKYDKFTDVGSVSVTSTSTAYNTSSDYRLKENLAPITGAVDRVNALQPRRFNFIAEPDKVVDGFVAHEVSDIVPEAITGEKDAVDENGNPEYQGIDQSKLVPLLTAAIQELTLTTQQLTARIEALEAA